MFALVMFVVPVVETAFRAILVELIKPDVGAIVVKPVTYPTDIAALLLAAANGRDETLKAPLPVPALAAVVTRMNWQNTSLPIRV